MWAVVAIVVVVITSTTTSLSRLQVARQSYILEVSHIHLCDWRRSLAFAIDVLSKYLNLLLSLYSRHYVFGSYVCLSVRPFSINTYFAWRDIYLLNGGIWFLGRNILRVRLHVSHTTYASAVCQPSVVVLFPSPRPYSGTHCRWMSSLPLHFPSSASVWRHSSSTNHFLMLYDIQTTLSWT